MIVTRRISLRKLIGFTWPKLLMLVVFTAFACVVMQAVPRELLTALSYAAGFLGTALAFLIGFRNNAAYGRWWEGHQIWSRLKYESRSFALMVLGLIGGGATTDAQRRTLIHRQIAFAWRLNRFLRGQVPGPDDTALMDAQEREAIEQRSNPPLAILDLQNRQLQALAAQGHLDSYRSVQLVSMLRSFNDVLGSCERLKKTPFPMQYTWFMNYTLIVFLLVLPITLAGHLGYWAIPFALLIGYAYVMLEYVGRYIENPFENEVNDVPMDYIARSIEIDLREMLGEKDLPVPVVPRGKGYLY
jgi:ion channel-forming bestrophin family protein